MLRKLIQCLYFLALTSPVLLLAAPLAKDVIQQFLTANNAPQLNSITQQFKSFISKEDYDSARFAMDVVFPDSYTINQKLVMQKVNIALSSSTLRRQLLPKLLEKNPTDPKAKWIADATTTIFGTVPLENKIWQLSPQTKKLLLPYIKNHIPSCTHTTNMPLQIYYYNYIRTLALLSTASYQSVHAYIAHYILHEKNPFCQNILVLYSYELCHCLSKPEINRIIHNLDKGIKKAKTKHQQAILNVASSQLKWSC